LETFQNSEKAKESILSGSNFLATISMKLSSLPECGKFCPRRI